MVGLRTFIKQFTWEEGDRERVVLGPGTRLNPETHRAQLGSWDSEQYPTDPNLYVKSWLTNPRAVRRWIGFEAYVVHKRVDGEQVTSEGFRLSDGTDEYWWDGVGWVVSGSGWNTQAQVAANISEFPAATRKLQVVVNLATSNAAYTPELIEVRVAYEALLDSEIEDMVMRSFVPALREAVRAVTRFPIPKAESSNKIRLSDYQLDGDMRIVGVDAAYNHVDDPDHNEDLFESFTTRSTPDDPWTDGTVDVITLNKLVPDGVSVWLRLLYEPVVAIETSRDWYELAHVPALVIESVSFTGRKLWGEDHVGNRGDYTAKVLPAPRQGRLDIGLAGIADKLPDHDRLSAAVTRFFGERPSLASTGLDESYRLWLVGDYERRGGPNAEDLHTWRKTIRIEDFRVWDQDARDGHLVQRFVIQGSLGVTIE